MKIGSLSGEEFDEIFDGLIDFMVGAFNADIGGKSRVRPVLERAIGDRTVDAVAQLEQEDGLFVTLGRHAIAIGALNALDQAVRPQLAQVVAQLSRPVVGGLEPEGGEDLAVQSGAGPAAQMAAHAADEDFEDSHQSRVIEPDAGQPAFTHGDRLGQFGDQVKRAVDIEVLGLIGRKAIDDGGEALAHRFPVGEGLVELEVLLQLVADDRGGGGE